MREIPEIGHEASTLLAVGLGATLATIGGFLGTLLEAKLQERERERTAALTFGEILASLRVLVRAVQEAHGRGEPFGPVTLRLLQGARRDVDAYERSRPALSDLKRAELRLSIHAIMIRMMLAIDGVLQSTEESGRQASYDFLLEITPGLDKLIRQLMPIAGQRIDPYDSLSHRPAQTDPAAV